MILFHIPINQAKNDRNLVTLSKCNTGTIWRYERKWSRKKEEPNIAYVMTNNIQQIRESLQELYITMGQEQLAIRAKDLFKLSQSQLSKTLGIWLKVDIFKIRLFGWKIVRFVPSSSQFMKKYRSDVFRNEKLLKFSNWNIPSEVLAYHIVVFYDILYISVK